MTVSDVLRDRMQEPGGLDRTTALSTLIHVALLGAVVFLPGRWVGTAPDEPRAVMTITLGGGTPGPESGGLTPMAARPVQQVTPPNAPREAERAPAAKAPEMTIPEKNAKPLKSASSSVAQAPDQARGRTPTRGAETSDGNAIAATGVRGQGFGLSTGGGAGVGAMLDVANFCCPEYLVLMVQKIRSNWNSQAETPGEVGVRFVIERTGIIAEPSVERSSGVFALDQNALRALVGTRQLPALPDAYPNPTLTVHVTFQYTK